MSERNGHAAGTRDGRDDQPGWFAEQSNTMFLQVRDHAS